LSERTDLTRVPPSVARVQREQDRRLRPIRWLTQFAEWFTCV
jgi:hypothetical protein